MQRNTPPVARQEPEDVQRQLSGGRDYGSLVPAPEAPQFERGVSARPVYHPSAAARHERHRTPWFAWVIGGCLSLLVVVVLFCAVVVGALGGLAFRFASTQNATETKSASWSVQGAPALRVQSDSADVHIQTGGDGHVNLVAALSAHATSEGDARDALKKVSVTATQSGDAVSIDAQSSQAASLGVSLAVTLTVTVPRQTSVVVVMQAGSAEVNGVSGSISTSVHDGSVKLSGVSLTAASLVDVQNGDATVTGVLRNGASLDLQVASGNASVTLPKTAPVAVDAVTAAGNVTITGWTASPGRSGTGSSLHVETVTTRSTPTTPTCALSIHVQSGNINLQFTE